MALSPKTVSSVFRRVKSLFGSDGAQVYSSDQPLRLELFSLEKLEQHAKTLAAQHELDPHHGKDQLLPRLKENEEILLDAYQLVTAAVQANRRITPAGDWLLDNFYLIEEQIRTTRKYFPKKYSRELPRLLTGSSVGFPRVYDIALELISHVDGRVDAENLSTFIASYQSVSILTLGELWAMPIMLRLAMIENLRRVASRMAPARIDRDNANYWADKMTEMVEKDPKNLILVMADMARANPPMSSAFVAEFARRLQGQGPAFTYPLTWIEQRLSEESLTIDQLIQTENQRQATDQITIGNSIMSLRFLDAMDWHEFVETLSSVEQILRKDPADVYNDMDFATRDRYRHMVEKLAKNIRLSEDEVARAAIDLSNDGVSKNGRESRSAHVGFYLIDQGLPALEKSLKIPFSFSEWLFKTARRFSLLLYLSSITFIATLGGLFIFWRAYEDGFKGWLLAGITLLSLIATSHLAVSLVNWISTLIVKPRKLPKMDFSDEIPSDLRTLVVVPTFLTSAQNIESLLEGLEVRYLGNKNPHIHFALLTDFPDASQETLPEDKDLLELARKGIENLNEKYSDDRESAPFFIFHRPRRWNPQEKIWMGYERKRGKLTELNLLLRKDAGDRFSLMIGDLSILPSIKYVITLDTDTQLPRDAARNLIGTMAHLLNRPKYDETKGRVTEGYSILQPMVATSLTSVSRSWFARIFGGETGIDPYTRVISNVYQDLFQEGSFIGKGIYDVDAFQQAMENRVPENQILSHDLLEGSYARAGLVSDVQLYEDYPSHYTADVSRRHRWIRGDWQIISWLFWSVPGPKKQRLKNPISLLSRWKIFDNLRRSLVPVAVTLIITLGWILFSPAWLWTCFVLAIFFTTPLLSSMVEIFQKSRDIPWKLHLKAVIKSTLRHFTQTVFTLFVLPYEAFFSLDAIVRTIFRMIITRKRLLEWQTASDAERHIRTDLGGFYKSMWIAPVFTIGFIFYFASFRPDRFLVAGYFLWIWLLSPAVAWLISLELVRRPVQLDEEQNLFLRKLARKTWRFFETFVGPEDHWLPPDNYQEHPVAVIAHRTSPTNIGLSLLSNLAAYDFGYIPISQLLDRTAKTLQTIESMEKYRGHLYNWYDTRSLQPLPPHYISTVDSGNLAGHLLVLKTGISELVNQKILPSRLFEGLLDTLHIVHDVASGAEPGKKKRSPSSHKILPRLESLEEKLNVIPTTFTEARQLLEYLSLEMKTIMDDITIKPDHHLLDWMRLFEKQCRDHLEDLTFLDPAFFLPAPLENIWTTGSPERLEKLNQLREVLKSLDEVPTLSELAKLDVQAVPIIEEILKSPSDQSSQIEKENKWIIQLKHFLKQASSRAYERIQTIEQLALQCQELTDIPYDFLYDKARRLMVIGYNTRERRRDTGYYDLLASEARQCSFIAIAQGQVPQEHWFALGRILTNSNGHPTLLSWSGSMFEYLMPLVIMPTYENTLLDQTYKTAVERQREYGKEKDVPWGFTESGYNVTDAQLNYQYRAFGVPGMGFKRGLADDLVVAPYGSVLALMVAPEEACKNLEHMAAQGFEGRYGFHEAIDYTPSRLSKDQTKAVIRSFMAHHQGMSLLSLAHYLLDQPMQKRFKADPLLRATELLLQEKIPQAAPIYPHASEVSEARRETLQPEAAVRIFRTPNTLTPQVHLLSNGRYHVMITNAGGGYSRWKELAVTRWREDPTRDCWGTFCYIRDIASGQCWSTTYQPTLKAPSRYEAIFSQARVEFRRQDYDIDIHTEITVSPEDDIELRRTTLVNRSRTPRTLELTSYAEVILTSPVADAIHPAFNNLFVQTEIIHARQSILSTRRPRSPKDQSPWMFHLMTLQGAETGEASYETDRWKFIGRGRTSADPQAILKSSKLSNSQGAVLDPIVSIRRTITLGAEETATIDIITGIAETREMAMGLIEKYQDRRLTDRVFELAWTHKQIVLSQLNITQGDVYLYERLASSIIYANPKRRAQPHILMKNRRGQSGLWGYGISGDLPIVLLRMSDPSNIELARHMIQAHAYWRMSGLLVDLVIWNEDVSGYRQQLQDQIMGFLTAGAQPVDRPGGIFLRRAEQMSDEDKILQQTVARIIIADNEGTLSDQIERRRHPETRVPRFTPVKTKPISAIPERRLDLVFFNGLGGFTKDGKEYVITTRPDQVTPAPWSNVLANPHFGTVISESGGSYTWCENAQQFRLTPWGNDPLSDSSGEAFYIRDEESGRFWSPAPLPARGLTPYITRHGFGYSVFEHVEEGISSEFLVYVSMDSPVKFLRFKIRNRSGQTRHLSLTGYVEWVLGELRSNTLMHVITEIDPKTGALFARNPYNIDFPNRVAFFGVNGTASSISADRSEFLGRNGLPSNPAAMSQTRLSGKVGAALDPCASIQVQFDLSNGNEREAIFILGVGKNIDEARDFVQRFRERESAQKALEAVQQYWNHTLSKVRVETPDLATNFLTNGWLLYQTLACRFWARSGYYQSGGAFGFRDQLQDVLALAHTEPRLIREHILRCASHQFREGDVQHWWHPPSNRGVRTRCSDDYLWLPFAVSRYVTTTGDLGILDERVHFLEGRSVKPEEDAYYDLPAKSDDVGTLYEHCVRAITYGLKFGEHGLPLMGTGDWNDGMNLVGEQGKGESVWLGFFLYDVLKKFSQIAHQHNDIHFAERCEAEAVKLQQNLEQNAWDGEWYLRAYFDNGELLGSVKNLECQIDSLPQSWSVLSGAGASQRSRTAMQAVKDKLIRSEQSLILLLDPPFDQSPLNPGYIKGYPPGVRENGGQYTHAAIWAVMAFAALEEKQLTWDFLTMLNPINRSLSLEKVMNYRVEPYVIPGDIKSFSSLAGQGGWTWYTGAAGWMYQLILESLLGLKLKVNQLSFMPCLPQNWTTCKIQYRYHETSYHIHLTSSGNKQEVWRVILDGVEQTSKVLTLVNDLKEHLIEVHIK